MRNLTVEVDDIMVQVEKGQGAPCDRPVQIGVDDVEFLVRMRWDHVDRQ